MNFAEMKHEDWNNLRKKCDEATQSKIPEKENDYVLHLGGMITNHIK